MNGLHARPPRSAARRFADYALAVLSVLAAYGISRLFPAIFQSIPSMLFWGAVIFSAGLGRGPALTSVILSLLAMEHLQTGSLIPSLGLVSLLQHLIFLLLAVPLVVARSRYQRAQMELQTILESAVDFAIMTLDLEGCVTSWNEGAERVFGFRRNEILGRSFDLLFTAEDQAEGIPAEELRQARTQGVSIDERWQRRQDGQHFYASGTVRPICDPNGKAVGFVKIARDQTQHRILEQERAEALIREQEARTRLEKLNAVILRFVAVVSHEVRAPLTTIKGFIDTLLAKDVTWTPTQQREFLGIMDKEADRMERLTRDLMDYTRLETGTLRVLEQETNFDEVLSAAMPTLTALTEEHHPFEVLAPNPSPPLRVDIERIGQVLVNLVGNAARYAAEGTPITISGEVVDDMLRVDVIDHGPGIPSDRRETIFTPFQQVGADQRRETKGAGLGLSIARGIVESHGGRIWIEDRDGPGLVVSFTLPLDGPAPPTT